MPFEVYVKCLRDAKNRKFEVESTTTVLDLLELIEEKTAIPVSQIKIVLAGRAMDNDKTLGDYGIGPDSTKKERKMHCILILR
jgi:hypothetical protein